MAAKTASPLPPEDRSGDTPAARQPVGRALLGLPELTAQFQPLTITVGDLFASADYLVYLPLESTQYTGSLAGIGFLIGGLGGSLTATISNAQNIKYARELAAVARRGDYGVPLEERVWKYKGLVLPRSGIGSIELINQGRAIRITHAGASLDLGSDDAEARCRQLQAWLADTLSGELDTQGANLDLPPAAALLPSFIDGSLPAKFSEQALSEIASEQNYLEGLFMVFDLKDYPKKVAVINTVLRLPVKWAAVFGSHLEALRAKGLRRLRWAAVLSALGLIGIIYYFLPFVSGKSVEVMEGGFFISLLSIPWFFLSLSYYNKIKKLLSLIKPA
jgi:hypothetical protein